MDKNAYKYIDLNQFPMNKNGNILWNKSVGMTVYFFYYQEQHAIKILNYGKPNKDYIEISVDGMPSEIVNTQKIRKLAFDNLFAKPNYLYNIGDVVNETIILEQLYLNENNGKGCKKKYYKCKCLVDNYEYIIRESELKKGRKCPKCTGKVLIVGHNDLATTDPYIIQFLLNKDDGYKYSRCSHKYVWTICPFCKTKKEKRVEELVLKGFSCEKCSDGLSYPNKFAHNVFDQIHIQYKQYEPEYSPLWAGKMRYDNYIILSDDRRIVVEMDGGFHYNDFGRYSSKNDSIKNELAKKHGIEVIRVNCFYNKITERFEFIKNNFIEKLQSYFDFSDVDWSLANKAGISNKLIDAVNYYNEHPFMTNQQIADYFHVNVVTIRHYLTVGEELNLCKYIRHDPNRCKTSIPLILYDSNNNFIGVYISARHMAEEMKDYNFCSFSINESVRNGKPYKGYIAKRITWEEYEEYQNAC